MNDVMDVVLRLAALVGHGCLLVLGLNIVHGLRINGRVVNLVTVGTCAVAALVGLAVVVAYWGTAFGAWPGGLLLYATVCAGVSLIGLPWTTIRRHRRRVPAELTVAARTIDLGEELGMEALRGTAARGRLLGLPGNESLRLRMIESEIRLPGVHRDLDGLTILLVGDLHFTRAYQRRYFEEVAARMGEEEADLVLFTGDLLDDVSCGEWTVPVLGGLTGRLGRVAVLGNHDVEKAEAEARRGLAEAGFQIIEGGWERYQRGDAVIAVAGTCAPWGPLPRRADAPPADLRILLSHSPDQVYRAASWGINLMFAGHNHGGQVRLPVIGPMLMPSRYSRRFDQGAFRVGGTLMYVTGGIGAEFPIRYGCPPEFVRFRLRCVGAEIRRESGRERTLIGAAGGGGA